MAKDRTPQGLVNLQLRKARRRRRFRFAGKVALVGAAGTGTFFGGRAIFRALRPLKAIQEGIESIGSAAKNVTFSTPLIITGARSAGRSGIAGIRIIRNLF